jgi:hypothetical protein
MSELGLPFQGDAWYYIQSAYSSKPTDGDSQYPISCKIQDMRYGIGDKHKGLKGFDAPNTCHLLEQCSDITLHLEYIPQCDDTLITDTCNRTAQMQCKSLAFVLQTNRFVTNKADTSSFLLWGCKPKTIRVSATINTEYLIAIDFSVKEVESVASDTLGLSVAHSAPTALTGAYLAFNVAGTIRDGNASDLAYIADSISFTIDHNLTDKWNHDSVKKEYCIEGAYDVEGTVDISLDEGGRSHSNDVLFQTPFDLIVSMGGAGCPVFTIPNCQWKSGEIDVNTSGDILADSAPFTGKPTDGDVKVIVA